MAIKYNIYPSNIHAAAKILDNKMPGWAKEINISILEMEHYHSCILGQLGGYHMNMKKLFKVENAGTSYTLDEIFGTKADKQKWIAQINKRLGNKFLSPIEVVELLQNGGRVRRRCWNNNAYFELKNNQLEFTNCISIPLDLLFYAADWVEFTGETFADIGVNEQFKERVDGPTLTKVCIRADRMITYGGLSDDGNVVTIPATQFVFQV